MTDKKKILVIDDELTNRAIVDVFKQEGYEVISAFTGEEALGQLKKIKPDLMIIDYYMPGMTGIELYIKVKEDESLKDTKVLFLTAANFSQEIIDKLISMGSSGYIQKPFEYDMITNKVKEILGR